MKVVATIEARMTSSRLPGKVLMPVLGKPMLYYLVERLKATPSIDEIVLATTVNSTDDALESFAKSEDIACFRGSEDDVMGRVIGAAESVDADIVVEITGDSPVIDPFIVEHIISMFRVHDADYVGNTDIQTYPIGLGAQVFLLKTLKRSAEMTNAPLDREHVTLHIRNNPHLFSKLHLIAPPQLYWPELALTLDEPEDYELIKKVIENFYPDKPLFDCMDMITLLRKKPEWVAINDGVRRKGDT